VWEEMRGITRSANLPHNKLPHRTYSPCCCGRRELFARAGAVLAGFGAVQAASAKAGQFGKVEIFSLVGEPAISSPYQPGGPKAGKDSTYGYAKSEGEFVANGYEVRTIPSLSSASRSPRMHVVLALPLSSVWFPAHRGCRSSPC
jgi:hypothetical protein